MTKNSIRHTVKVEDWQGNHPHRELISKIPDDGLSNQCWGCSWIIKPRKSLGEQGAPRFRFFPGSLVLDYMAGVCSGAEDKNSLKISWHWLMIIFAKYVTGFLDKWSIDESFSRRRRPTMTFLSIVIISFCFWKRRSLEEKQTLRVKWHSERRRSMNNCFALFCSK